MTKGAYLGQAMNKDGEPINNYYFAAPVKIGNKRKIMFVRVRETENTNKRFYVHEIFSEDQTNKARTDSEGAIQPAELQKNADLYLNIIAKV